MDCSMPGLSVLHHLLEFAQTHIHWVSDAAQPSHPLLLPSSLAFNLSQHQVFSNASALPIGWPKYWSLSMSLSNEYSMLISFRIDWFDLLVQYLQRKKQRCRGRRLRAGKLFQVEILRQEECWGKLESLLWEQMVKERRISRVETWGEECALLMALNFLKWKLHNQHS